MKYLTYIIFLLLGITILIVSFYVQIKHQKGIYKSEIPQDAVEEIIKEYKEIRGINGTPIDAPTPTTSEESEVVTPEPTPTEQQARLHSAIASYYDQSACGEKTYKTDCYVADYPELFDEQALTVAHRSMEFGTIIKFSHNDSEVECRVNDRGPFVAGREFDLSLGCARALGITEQGIAKVAYKIK